MRKRSDYGSDVRAAADGRRGHINVVTARRKSPFPAPVRHTDAPFLGLAERETAVLWQQPAFARVARGPRCRMPIAIGLVPKEQTTCFCDPECGSWHAEPVHKLLRDGA